MKRSMIIHSCVAYLLTMTVGVSAVQGQPASSASDSVMAVWSPSEFWGVALDRPVNRTGVRVGRCSTARAWATVGGRFSRIADDYLFSVPHEHHDTAGVLRVLDSATVCAGRISRVGASVLMAVVDSNVVQAVFMFPDSLKALSVDSVTSELTAIYGKPDTVYANGGRAWFGDSTAIYVHRRGPFLPTTFVSVSHARACAWFETRLHRPVSRAEPAAGESRDCMIHRTAPWRPRQIARKAPAAPPPQPIGPFVFPDAVGSFVRGKSSRLEEDTTNLAYSYSNGSSVRVTVFVYPISIAEGRDSDRRPGLAVQGETFFEALPLGVQRGRWDEFKKAFSRPDSVKAGDQWIPGYATAAATRFKGVTSLQTQHVYALEDHFVKVRATLPGETWKYTNVPGFASELIATLAEQSGRSP